MRYFFAGLMLVIVSTLAACGGSSPATRGPVNDQPATGSGVQKAVTLLPPGQSGFFSTSGQAAGQASGNPADYGPNIDDQREPYWASEWKDGNFKAPPGTPEEPKAGVRIYRDDFGVPIVYADTVFDVWYGAGYAIAQDRLFLMDAVRRMARGTFAELTGCESVPGDIQQRVLTYSEAEYNTIYDSLPQLAKDALNGYIEGANNWVAEANSDPNKLPAEYGLLTTTPAPLDRIDVLASGVFITRFVASDGGNEFENVQALKDLTTMHGAAAGKQIFQDLFWLDDRKAAVTVPDATFSNNPTPPAQRDSVFNTMADYALTLPDELATGPGTGDSPVPNCLTAVASNTASPKSLKKPLKKSFDSPQQKAIAALENFRRNLSGGSYSITISGDKTASGKPMLLSAPQLGYSYPSLLHELEVHGAGFDVRGSSVPALPVIGIGYTPHHAWALTTGYSKTIDSFIETTRVPASGDDPEYFHDGQWKPTDCRDEVINYRQATSQGVPVGPASFSVTERVCRTIHGPIVAMTADNTQARSVKYAMFLKEIDTIKAVQGWNTVTNFADFDAAMAQATWNENLMYADDDGNIAYYHPGLHIRRHPDTDQRFPSPGEGDHDPDGLLTFAETPKSINPAQGFLANWNNKPAYDWGDSVGGNAVSLPAGHSQRVTNWFELLPPENDLTLERLIELDREAGIVDPRAREFLPYLLELRAQGGQAARESQALDILAAWDTLHHRRDLPLERDITPTDTAGATIFDRFVKRLRVDLFQSLLPAYLFERMEAVGSHKFDQSPLDNLALKVLDADTSSIALLQDYTSGKDRLELVEDALKGALDELQAEFSSADPATYQREHPRAEICSLTGGVIGPCVDMPYQDRGSWNHIVSFE